MEVSLLFVSLRFKLLSGGTLDDRFLLCHFNLDWKVLQTSFPRTFSQVKDVSLDLIGRLATSLEILELRSLIITDRALAHLAAAGGSPALKRIVLAGCPYISDKGLMSLSAQESFFLRSVDVRHCRDISTPALARFMVRCPTLEQMDVDKGRTEELDAELQKLRASMA